MKQIAVSILLIIAALGVFAQPNKDNLPENFFYRKLANGLDVLVIEDPTVPLATVELCVKNGAFTESPEYDGLSHLYEHMFFKANKVYPSQEQYLQRVKELGLVFNGTTSHERVNYFFTIQNKYLKEGLQFMNDAIRYPLFLKEEMEKENFVVDAEFERNESNPFFFLMDDMAKHMWGQHYSRKNVIGDHEIIKTATPEKMRTIKERFYYPNNSILAIAGDVEHNKVFDMVRDIFDTWEASDFVPFIRHRTPEFVPLQYSSQFITESEIARVPIFMVSFMGPDTRASIEDTYAADVFSFILSQKTSRLQKELVDAGLALQVNVGYQTLKHVGPIQVVMVPNPQRMEEAYAKLWEHINMWDSEDYFTDEQMQTAKDLLAVNEAYGSEKTSDFVHTVTYWWASASIDYYSTYVDKLQQVTRQDIKRYVDEYIKEKPYVAGLLISPAMRSALNVDSFFTNTYSPDTGYVFRFRENTAEFSNPADSIKLLSLGQFMQRNPEVQLLVNGNADKAEFSRIKDKEMKKFMESRGKLQFSKEDILPKQFVRLDIMRAMSIIKPLVESGIDESRFAGSGRIAKSNSPQEKQENMKVVIKPIKK